MNVEVPCEVCGSREARQLYEIDGYRIVRCRVCALVFVANPPTTAELIELYGEAYYEDDEAVGYASYEAAESRKRLHDRSLLTLIGGLVAPGVLLEIGCAYGYFLDEARKRGWSVRGVEPSGHAAAHARDRLGLDVTETPFADLPVEAESQDAIVLWDVIEHLPNPRMTMERAHQWLRPGGILALSTGDVDSLVSRLHGADWSLMTPPWHQFYFSRATITRLLQDVGLHVERIGGDGNVAVDRSSRRPRVPGPLAALLTQPLISSVARRFGAGGIMFVYARKADR